MIPEPTNSHWEHALESYRLKEAADNACSRNMHELGADRMIQAQWHATMAVYELSLMNVRIK